MHALHYSVAQSSRLILLSVSPNNDEYGKQSLYPDGDPNRHLNTNICSLAHCQPSLTISGKSVRKFLRYVATKQTDRQTNNDQNITSLAEVINNKRSAVAEMGDRGHNRQAPKRRGCCVPYAGELGPRLTQCGLDRGLLLYQVASSSIQPFGHNRHGPGTRVFVPL